jgi:hypothetical protein
MDSKSMDSESRTRSSFTLCLLRLSLNSRYIAFAEAVKAQ